MLYYVALALWISACQKSISACQRSISACQKFTSACQSLLVRVYPILNSSSGRAVGITHQGPCLPSGNVVESEFGSRLAISVSGMPCTICGDEGHNARTCPPLSSMQDVGMDDDKMKRLQSVKRNLTSPEKANDERTKSMRNEPSNADIMERLGDMMQNMATKSDLEALRVKAAEETKLLVSVAVDPIKDELTDLKTSLEAKEVRIKKLEEAESQSSTSVDKARVTNDPALAKRIEELEKLVAGMSLSATGDGKDNATGVVGGLQGAASVDTAKSWLNDILQRASIDGILDVYHKGNDNFNGMLFVKFASSQKRDVAIRTFNSLRSRFADKRLHESRSTNTATCHEQLAAQPQEVDGR